MGVAASRIWPGNRMIRRPFHRGHLKFQQSQKSRKSEEK